MKKEKFVFVAISTVYTESIFTGGVEVSTTLRGLCRLIKGNYVAISKAWSRWEDKMICLEVRNKTGGDWKIYRKELDTVWGRGGVENFKKNNGGFRGFKGDDGRLTDKPAKDRMGFNEVINTWKEGDGE